MTAMSIWPGSPSPLGATSNGSGVNFALFSEHATEVKLCLFDSPDATLESHRAAREDQSGLACLPAGLIIGFPS
jgi:isoamylase